MAVIHKGVISGAGSPNYLYGAAGIWVEGNYAYVGGTEDASLTIFDISDPTNPTHVGAITGTGAPNYLYGGYYLVKDGNYIYVSSHYDDALVIIDVSIPAVPTLSGEIHGTGAPNYLNAIVGLVKDGNYVYILTRSDHGLTIIDVSNPAAPAFESYLPSAPPGNSLWAPEDIAKSGNYIYITSDYGITSVDVSNPAAPALVDYIRSSPQAQCIGIKISGNYAYVTLGYPYGLNVIDISNPASLSVVASLQDSVRLDGTYLLTISGNIAYVTGRDLLTSVDISNPLSPRVESSITGAGAPNYLDDPYGVAVANNYVFVAAYNDVLTIFGKAAISGYVYDQQSNPIASATVRAAGGSYYPTTSDSTGAYSLTVDPGIYNVTASKTNYHSDTQIVDASSSDQTQNFTLNQTQATLAGGAGDRIIRRMSHHYIMTKTGRHW